MKNPDTFYRMIQFSVSNPCDASPCGPGTCWQGQEPLSYLCVCPPEWTGDNCDEVAGEYCMGHCVVGGRRDGRWEVVVLIHADIEPSLQVIFVLVQRNGLETTVKLLMSLVWVYVDVWGCV